MDRKRKKGKKKTKKKLKTKNSWNITGQNEATKQKCPQTNQKNYCSCFCKNTPTVDQRQ